MKTAIQLNIEMFGVTKRVKDLRELLFILEKQNKTQSSSVITEDNCVALFYPWGHIILYTYPKSRVLTINFFSDLCRVKVNAFKKGLVETLTPEHYDEDETIRTIG